MTDPDLKVELLKARTERDAAVAALKTAETANVRQLRLLMEEQDRFVEGLVTRHEQELRSVRASHEEELSVARSEIAKLLDRVAHCESELALARTLLDAAMGEPIGDQESAARPVRSGFVAKKGSRDAERPSERPTMPPDPTLAEGLFNKRLAAGSRNRTKPPSR